jgi:hypothetical protein
VRIRKKIYHNILGVGSMRALVLLWNLFLIAKVSPELYGEFSYTYSTVIALSGFAYLGFNIAIPKIAKEGLEQATIGFLFIHVLFSSVLILFSLAIFTSVNLGVPVVLLTVGFAATNTCVIIINTIKAQELLPKLSAFFIIGFVLALIPLSNEYLLVPAIAYASFGLVGVIILFARNTVIFGWDGFVGYKLILRDSVIIDAGTLLNGLVITVANEYMLDFGGTAGFALIGELRQIQSLILIVPTLIFPVLVSEKEEVTLSLLRFLPLASALLFSGIISLIFFELSENLTLYLCMLLSIVLSVLGLVLSPLLLDSGAEKFMISNFIWSIVFGSLIVFYQGSPIGFVFATFFAYMIQLIYFLFYIWKMIHSRRLLIVFFLILEAVGLVLLVCC